MSDHDQTGTLSRERFLLESARQERLDRESEAQRQWLLECLAAARREGAEEATLRAENAEATAYAWADADAYRRGAEEMRERARRATTFCCFECSRVIAALPLTPEERE